jgi:hypothetical protein
MNDLQVIEQVSGSEAYRTSTDAAGLCKAIVVQTAKDLGGRKYVMVEGWQAIAVAHGCTASARDVEKVSGGVRAIGEVRRMSDGVVISTAEGFVGEDEATWYGGKMMVWDRSANMKVEKVLEKRAEYAIRAMAQTRAISRACRSAFAHVVVMMNAGLQTTPAEEMTEEMVAHAVETAPAETNRQARPAAPAAAQAVSRATGSYTDDWVVKHGPHEGKKLSTLAIEELKIWCADLPGGKFRDGISAYIEKRMAQ